MDNLLFGSAVAVTGFDLSLLMGVTVVIVGLHGIFRREFLYVSADPAFMAIRGLKTRFWMVLLYFTLTLGITISMRTLGSLPVFALMVIPPFIALKKAKNLGEAVLVAVLLGVVIPPLGYYFSFLYSFPTGASLILMGLMYVLASLLEPVRRPLTQSFKREIKSL